MYFFHKISSDYLSRYNYFSVSLCSGSEANYACHFIKSKFNMPINPILQPLLKCSLFTDFSEDDINEFVRSTDYKLLSYQKNDVFALAGMPCRHIDIVLKGVLICRMSSPAGKQVEVSRLRPGNIVAPAFIFATNNKLPVSVETGEPTQIIRFAKDEFMELLHLDHRLCLNFIRTLSDIDSFLTQKINVLSLMTVREKVGYLLIKRAKEQQTRNVRLLRSRQQIADSFGIQKFSLMRVLADFEREGAIEINGRDIKIINADKLK